jgi:hypothetical protein
MSFAGSYKDDGSTAVVAEDGLNPTSRKNGEKWGTPFLVSCSISFEALNRK